ncbi:MAG: transketolase [Rickettsiales bacterium]|jgi:transketolase|nr:transketolase [Rickettsiales bacterium]
MIDKSLKVMADAIRCLSLEAIGKANSGHPGLPLGFADVATVLFSKYLKFSPRSPKWIDRDRFILSAGHGSMLLYSLLYLTGYEDCDLEEIKNFRQLGSKTTGHPEYGRLAAVETTTGPLGQGVANAVGMALGERHFNAIFPAMVDHKIYCMVGDGCLMEGVSYEALSLAGNMALKNLIVLWDNNEITIDGSTSITRNENMRMRMESIDFLYLEADGHDYHSIDSVLAKAQRSDRPVFLSFRTKIGFGSPKEGTSKCHGSPLSPEEIGETKKRLGCGAWGEFEIPDEVLSLWRAVGERGDDRFLEWDRSYGRSEEIRKFNRITRVGESEDDLWTRDLRNFRDQVVAEAPTEATRKSSQRVLEVLTRNLEGMLGGSADLTGSVLTSTPSVAEKLGRNSYGGRYIDYGIREQAMAGIMNGLALEGLTPYGGTFLCFSDYEKPALRLAAMMELPCLFIFTHDSIGLGEDGPTHQPIEQLANLRAIPNLNVFRPADIREAVDCYEVALKTRKTPSALVFSRQAVPFLEGKGTEANLAERGAYVLAEDKKALVTLIATGTEVSLALEVREELDGYGIGSRVVSAPCLDIFNRQDELYREAVLGRQIIRVAIEAAGSQGWHRYLGEKGMFFGIEDDSFGLSAPIDDLYEHFGITRRRISAEIMRRISGDILLGAARAKKLHEKRENSRG